MSNLPPWAVEKAREIVFIHVNEDFPDGLHSSREDMVETIAQALVDVDKRARVKDNEYHCPKHDTLGVTAKPEDAYCRDCVSDEREECAKVAEDMGNKIKINSNGVWPKSPRTQSYDIYTAIRERQ